jgi:deoxyribonuclease IV
VASAAAGCACALEPHNNGAATNNVATINRRTKSSLIASSPRSVRDSGNRHRSVCLINDATCPAVTHQAAARRVAESGILPLMRIGAHVDRTDPIDGALARKADLVQFFLTDPQGYKSPQPRADADAIRAASVDVYVHAPYIVNVATTNNRIRIPSRKLLLAHANAAADLGAKGLIVHGGHVNSGEDLALGVDNWRKTFAYAADSGGFPLPILIENTAGGDNACARRLDALDRLWEVVGEFGAGFCLDTCHAHAGGEELDGLVDRVRAITGRIDLVHANDSRDPFGSGRDRHANLGAGQIDLELLVGVIREAGAPVVVETPGDIDGQAADIAYLRDQLG